jgi:alkanesulfonate monooxygenase SsuD/methylene tetrahydromethanopterin reductase-like flavin-dependent oxidoreductase (luciferase family)
MAGRVADGVMMTDITLFHADDAIKGVRESLAQNGRSSENFRINNLFAWHVKEDKDEAIGEARRKLLVRGGVTPWYVSPFLSQEDCDIVQAHMPSFLKAYAANSPVIEGVPDRIIDELIEHLTLTGDLTDLDIFIEKLKKFEAAGFNEFALRIYDEPEKSIKLIGEQLVPVFS